MGTYYIKRGPSLHSIEASPVCLSRHGLSISRLKMGAVQNVDDPGEPESNSLMNTQWNKKQDNKVSIRSSREIPRIVHRGVSTLGTVEFLRSAQVQAKLQSTKPERRVLK